MQANMHLKKRDDDPMEKYILDHQAKLTPDQEGLRQATKALTWSVMISDPDQVSFLQNMVQLIGARRTLDVGVFTGFSAMSIAMVLPSDGKVVACDISNEYAEIGRPFWKSAGVEGKIDLRIAPAGDTLQNLIDNGEAGKFDFAYIDADKDGYDEYYEKCLVLVRAGGIIALDNMLWGGRVANPSDTSEATVAIRKMNDKIVQDERVRSNLLNIGDGTALVFKK